MWLSSSNHAASYVALIVGLLAWLFLLPCSGDAEWGEPVMLPPEVNQYGAYYARLAPYDTELYFTCDTSSYFEEDIWVVRWFEGVWDSTTRLGPSVNTSQRDLSPSVTADHQYLYFVSYDRPGGFGSYDIWYCAWEDTGWGGARNCGPNVNSPGIEFTACIAPDGQNIYFSSIRSGGLGELDIWSCAWEDTGWGAAENLGPNVNTMTRDLSPWISADGETLYWASWRSVYGSQDIYMSVWDSTGWAPKQVVPNPINSAFWDGGPSLSSDGHLFLFSSTRPDTSPVGRMWISEWITGVDERELPASTVASSMRILRSAPNPARNGVLIWFSLWQSSFVRLDLYDIRGRHVRSLLRRRVSSGLTEVVWDGRDENGGRVASGLYLCTLACEGVRCVAKIVKL